MKLIDKEALVAEIYKLKKSHDNWSCMGKCFHQEYENLLSFIDTLEVKEVNLDFQTFAKEMDAIFALPSSETKNTEENPLNWEYAIAKHFYLLGLAQKGEEVIEQTVEWLTKHAIKYYINSKGFLGTDKLVKDYKLIMSMKDE